MATKDDLEAMLPLTPAVFHILENVHGGFIRDGFNVRKIRNEKTLERFTQNHTDPPVRAVLDVPDFIRQILMDEQLRSGFVIRR